MRAVASRIVWIIGLFCLVFGITGLLAFSPVTVALAVTGWFLSRASIEYLSRQVDIEAPTPDLQYWARTLILRSVGLMAAGALIAAVFIGFGLNLHLSVHEQLLLTVLLVSSMIVVTKLTLPGFFAASWEIHGARERRKHIRSSMIASKFIVRAVAVMLVVISLVASFAMMQSIRLGAPQYSKMAVMARVVTSQAPEAVSGVVSQIFSPSDTASR